MAAGRSQTLHHEAAHQTISNIETSRTLLITCAGSISNECRSFSSIAATASVPPSSSGSAPPSSWGALLTVNDGAVPSATCSITISNSIMNQYDADLHIIISILSKYNATNVHNCLRFSQQGGFAKRITSACICKLWSLKKLCSNLTMHSFYSSGCSCCKRGNQTSAIILARATTSSLSNFFKTCSSINSLFIIFLLLSWNRLLRIWRVHSPFKVPFCIHSQSWWQMAMT